MKQSHGTVPVIWLNLHSYIITSYAKQLIVLITSVFMFENGS